LNLQIVIDAVLDRIKIDTTLYATGAWTAALPGGITAILGPQSASPSFPYGVINATWGEDNGAFEAVGAAFTVTITVVDKRENATDKLLTISNRLMGDSMKQATRLPSYGLHRWTPTLTTDATLNPLGVVADGCLYANLGGTGPEAQGTDHISQDFVFEGRLSAPLNP